MIIIRFMVGVVILLSVSYSQIMVVSQNKVVFSSVKDYNELSEKYWHPIFDKLVDEEVNVFGFSGDNEFCKQAWRNALGLIRDIRHPLVADTGLDLSSELGIVDVENGVCYRATYIVDVDGVIQHVSVNALDTGRSVDEVIRTLQGLRAGGLTGCSWQPGEDFVA